MQSLERQKKPMSRFRIIQRNIFIYKYTLIQQYRTIVSVCIVCVCVYRHNSVLMCSGVSGKNGGTISSWEVDFTVV